MIRDYGRDEFREIGRLSSMLPSYVRNCCRSLHDGTDEDVLNSFRETAYRVLLQYQGKYPFVSKHLEILRIYSPEDVKNLIGEKDNAQLIGCLATSTAIGLPKRACLHCPRVGQWLKRMERAGTMNSDGERYGK